MQITIDTANLSDLDKEILARLAGGVSIPVTGEFVSEPKEKPAPAKKAAAKKAAAKKPEPEPEPEPLAEEPVQHEDEEPEVEEEEVEEVEDEDVSDEDLLQLAVKKATEMVSGGEAAKVREALDAAGASRVRELNKDNVREFFKALS